MPTNRKNQGSRPRRKKTGNAGMKNQGRKPTSRRLDEDKDRETETPQE